MASSAYHQNNARPPPSHWEQHRELFRDLYLVRGMSLKEVKETAERDHNLPEAPLSTYEVKLRDELGLQKNMKAKDWAAIGRHLASRPLGSRVFYHGILISQERVKRYTRRNSKMGSGGIPPLPPNVTIRGPPGVDTLDARSSLSIALRRRNAPTTGNGLSIIQHFDDHRRSDAFAPGLAMGNSPPVSRVATQAPMVRYLDNSLIPVCQHQDLLKSTTCLLMLGNNMVNFVRFSAPVLDERIVKLWSPFLDKVPVLEFQRRVRGYLTDNNCLDNPFAHGSRWDSMSLRTEEEIDHMVAQELSLLPPMSSVSAPPPDLESRLPQHFSSHLSTFQDPFHAMCIIIHRLSNNAGPEDTTFQLLDQFAQRVPESLFKAIFALDCSSVRASWTYFLECTGRLENPGLFRSFARTMLRHHSQRSSRDYGILLNLAATFNCADICDDVIRHGGSPDTCSGLRMEGGYRETSPLIQAALRGNTETAEVLLRAGADVNSRAGGFTAAGRLLMVLKTESRLREQRLDMLRFLLNNGSDINAPFYRISMRPKDNKRNLLDEALMNGDNDVVTTFRELLSIDVEAQPTMTLSGIISCAKRGIDALRNYMRKPPSWKSRRHMEAAAMAWCLDRVNVQAVLTMLQAGFDPRLGFQVDVDFFISVYQNSPLTLPSRELALVILGDRLDTGKQADWIKTFLGSSHKDVLRLLFNIVLVSKGWDGTEMMVLAARSGNIAAVSLLHQEYRVEYDGTVEFLNTHCSVLLLSAASFRDTIGNPFGPLTAQKLAKFQPASIEMLGFLVRQGADINTCHPSLWSGQHRIDGEQLKWLIDNSPDRLGVSIYRIMFTFMQVRDFRNPQHDSDVERTILQSLANQYLPVFSEREAISFRHHRNIETDRHPLSFFISLKPGPGFIHQVLESGIDVNGRGKRPGTDTPLRAAARASDFDLVEKLVSLGAKVSDTEHDFGLTALQLACGARVSPEGGITTPQPANRRIAELLLENGADPKATGIFCCVSLLELVEDVVAFELLLDHGENANEVVARCEACSLAYTPCNSMLVLGHNISILQLKVLRYNEEEDPDTKDSLRGIIQVLLRRGARINERETVPDCGKRKPGRSTADMAAALPYMRDDLELLRWLLDAKAELTSSADFEKDTGIHIACSRGNVDFLKLLLDHGVDPNQINNHGDSPLSTAARNGYLAIVLLLLDHGVDPNQINKGGDSPLSTAACNGDLAIVLLLLAAGAGVPIDAQDAQRSPLVRAAEHGHLDIVALLMQLETREEVFEKAIWGAQSCDYVEVASSIEQYLEQRRHSI